ncbi:MAG: DUF2157 domain-containing protein [Nostocaceae cyanobacterium]|nr:DUF2157 domain-containing protein [Nostocaceae cyanobacterium]
MSSPSERRISILVDANNPHLIEGLDVWLRLGLLTESQVQQLSRQYLNCPLPEVFVTSQIPVREQANNVSNTTNNQPDFVLETPDEKPVIVPNGGLLTPKEPHFVTRILQSLMAELSVIWLLVLGVFMVVVSSAVLAATQWQRFPAVGQYLVLLAYTLTFWCSGLWTGRQQNLRLTATTLQIVSLLLVPVNFWAIDSFGLWHQGVVSLVLAAIALFTLSATSYFIWQIFTRNQPQQLPLVNYLLLSYLHWGWNFSLQPLIAVYLGLLFTTFTIHKHLGEPQRRGTISWKPIAAIGFAIAILLVRAIFVVGVEVAQLGLALGICGWLLVNINPQQQTRVSLLPVAGCLLFLGWWVSVADVPWQAFAVSGLGLWFFGRLLLRFWRRSDLGMIFAIGLQMLWLAWRLVPLGIQNSAIALLTTLSNSQDTPWALLAVVVFPYVILIVAIADWLYRRQKPQLAGFAEACALCLGCILTSLSLVNPLLRTLNLLASTITLYSVSQRRHTATLAYISHICGVVTCICATFYIVPNLSANIWAMILLAMMVGEWGFSLSGWRVWQRSAWHIGLALSAISYVLLWSQMPGNPMFAGLWLVTPASLTTVAYVTRESRREIAGWFSVGSVLMAQLLTLQHQGADVIGLGMATALMLFNTYYLQHLVAAGMTVGYGLGFVNLLLWHGVWGIPRLSLEGWLVLVGVEVLGLWVLRGVITEPQSTVNTPRRDEPPRTLREPRKRDDGVMSRIYAQGSDFWGILLCGLELICLTGHSVGVYWGGISPSLGVFLGIGLTMVGLVYRSWGQANNWTIYGVGWCIELLMVEVLGVFGRSLLNLSIANVALGLISQLLGEWYQRRINNRNLPNPLHILPLVYGGLAGILRWGMLTSWTGLSSLALALIAIGVGRRRAEFKPLVYLGMMGISLSAYEILFYQIAHLPFSQQLIAMAALGTSIMYVYRVLSPWLTAYLRFVAQELKFISHVHWVVSSLLLFNAVNILLTTQQDAGNFALVGLGTAAFLSRYAIFQARRHPNDNIAEAWVYLGLLEAAGVGLYMATQSPLQEYGEIYLPFASVGNALAALFFYVLPWERWGWNQRPWHRAALIVPLVSVWATASIINTVSLLVIAAVYVLIARITKHIQYSYISAFLIDWAIFRWLAELQLNAWFWYAIPVGLSILYFAQVEPALQGAEQKEARHSVRMLGTAVICGVAFISQEHHGLTPGIISLIAIFSGLALRVRAFLYVGTIVFLANAFYQLIILIRLYSFLKWVIGFVVGIVFIWIAANFETRRQFINALMRNWIVQLEEWE